MNLFWNIYFIFIEETRKIIFNYNANNDKENQANKSQNASLTAKYYINLFIL